MQLNRIAILKVAVMLTSFGFSLALLRQRQGRQSPLQR